MSLLLSGATPFRRASDAIGHLGWGVLLVRQAVRLVLMGDRAIPVHVTTPAPVHMLDDASAGDRERANPERRAPLTVTEVGAVSPAIEPCGAESPHRNQGPRRS